MIDLRSLDRQPAVTPLRSTQGHRSVGDSDEEFISTHVQKQIYKIGPKGDRPGNIWLGSSGKFHFWPSISTGLTAEVYFIFVCNKGSAWVRHSPALMLRVG